MFKSIIKSDALETIVFVTALFLALPSLGIMWLYYKLVGKDTGDIPPAI